jgi:hypothetical protein
VIDWATVKPAITSQMATLTGLDPSRVRWVDEPSGTLAGALPVVWMRVSSIVGTGIEYEQREDDPGGGEQTVSVIGHRNFTLSVRIESFTPDIADQRSALNIGLALRTRLKRSTAIQARAGIFAVREVLMSKWISYVEDGRPLSTYLLDLLCAATDVDTDTTTGAGDWVGEAVIDGAIKDGPPDSTIATVQIDAKAD